jgi:lysophospholipase L1-like esterase
MLGLRSYALADRWLAGRRARRASQTVLPPDVQTKLDLREGLGSYRRNATWRQGTIKHFGQNLRTMTQMARRAGVPIILVNPVSNLKDCPPFKSEFRTDLSPVQREHVADLWTRSDRLDWSQAHEKLGLVEQAAAIDDQHAGLLFATGTCYRHIGRPAEAKEWFVRAKDEDICPLRILEPMHKLIIETATQDDLPLVDVRTMIEERTEDGIPGNEWLLDHVHPTISGHKLIADALHQTMAEMDLVPSPDRWPETREELWRRHLASLNEAYFAQGLARLERLRQWSRGRIPDSLEDTP